MLWKRNGKLASLEVVDTKIKELKESLASEFISEADLKKLATEVETLSVKVMALIGHRLTSLTLIPTTHINGIPSIELLTLTYTPQVYAAVTGHQMMRTRRTMPLVPFWTTFL